MFVFGSPPSRAVASPICSNEFKSSHCKLFEHENRVKFEFRKQYRELRAEYLKLQKEKMVAMKKNLLNQTFSANSDARLKPTSKEETKEMKRELKTGPKRRRRRKRGYQRVCYYHYYKFSMKALSVCVRCIWGPKEFIAELPGF